MVLDLPNLPLPFAKGGGGGTGFLKASSSGGGGGGGRRGGFYHLQQRRRHHEGKSGAAAATEEAKFKAGNGDGTPGEAVGKRCSRNSWFPPCFLSTERSRIKLGKIERNNICEAVRSCELAELVYHVLLLKMHNAVVLTMENEASAFHQTLLSLKKIKYIGVTTKQLHSKMLTRATQAGAFNETNRSSSSNQTPEGIYNNRNVVVSQKKHGIYKKVFMNLRPQQQQQTMVMFMKTKAPSLLTSTKLSSSSSASVAIRSSILLSTEGEDAEAAPSLLSLAARGGGRDLTEEEEEKAAAAAAGRLGVAPAPGSEEEEENLEGWNFF